MIIIFVEFIDHLNDYPINCASLTQYKISHGTARSKIVYKNTLLNVVENNKDYSVFAFLRNV